MAVAASDMGEVVGYRGDAYRKVIAKLGLSANRAADFFGYARRQSRRILAGTHKTSTAVTLLIAVMLEAGMTVAMVNDIAKRGKTGAAQDKDATDETAAKKKKKVRTKAAA